MASGADTHTHTHTHTNTHTDVRTKVISRNQARAGHRPAHAWFKNYIVVHIGTIIHAAFYMCKVCTYITAIILIMVVCNYTY